MDREHTYRGGYGKVTVSGKKAVKRGQVSTWEVSNLRRLNDTGITPRYLDHQWKKGGSREEEEGSILYEAVLEMEALVDYVPLAHSDFEEVSYSVLAELFVEAMAQIHLRGVAHLDLHGRNVLVHNDLRSVAIVDFGRSRYNYRLAFLEAVACLGELFGDFDFRNRPEFETKVPWHLRYEYRNPEGFDRVKGWLSSFRVPDLSLSSCGPELEWEAGVKTLYELLGAI